MMNAPIQEFILKVHNAEISHGNEKTYYRLPLPTYWQTVLLLLTIILLLGSVVASLYQSEVYAANPGRGNVCSWYRVRAGDTLDRIAWNNHTTALNLGRVNHILNINLIFVGQALCIPRSVHVSQPTGGRSSGLLPNGNVRWYAYNSLDWSTHQQITQLLRQAAARYGLPANLLFAVAWQESGWNQHVIARDGGIGTMQLMPYTAMGINALTGVRRDPYRLSDNIDLGAIYLRWLWTDFHGNLAQVISAYNEGGWAVIHWGIFNWSYVNSVLYLMNEFR